GILKSLGASRWGVMHIFLGYGFLLGVVGSILGTILGLVITYRINEIEQWVTRQTGEELFPRDVYYFNKIPVDVQPMNIFLIGLDLRVQTGEFVSVIGASGSGKSTLLHLLGTLDRPDSGAIALDGRRIDNLPAKERDRLRNQTFGFIFQFYHLLPELSALEN